MPQTHLSQNPAESPDPQALGHTKGGEHLAGSEESRPPILAPATVCDLYKSLDEAPDQFFSLQSNTSKYPRCSDVGKV